MKNLRAYDREELGNPRRFVKACPPPEHAGVGAALRQAFHPSGESATISMFKDLLARLD